jgi:Na+-driven multidrug efflux pump
VVRGHGGGADPLGTALIGFFSDTSAVIRAGTAYLRGIMPFYVLFAVFFTLNNAMRGAGESVFPMVNTGLSLILLRVPAGYLIANRFGPEYMYYGFGVGWAAGFAATVIYYLSGRWKRRGSLADRDQAAPAEG